MNCDTNSEQHKTPQGGAKENTIIDILNVGDQELFHSNMIAWLLNPDGEHGIHSEFGDRIFDQIPETRGAKVSKVEREKTEGKVRYDIWILTTDATIIVFENKTKSFGGRTQLENYENTIGNGIVIALGLDELNFEASACKRFISYRIIHDALKEISARSSDTAYNGLISHYQTFLERELHRLETIRRVFCQSDAIALQEIMMWNRGQIHGKDSNGRYYNSFYLALLREHLDSGPLKGFYWVTNKNLQSGVVMHQHNPLNDTEHPRWALEPKYFDESMLSCWLKDLRAASTNQWAAAFWTEIELGDGLFATDAMPCGEIRLKASLCKDSPMTAPQIQKNFQRAYENVLDNKLERFPNKSATMKANTFNLLHYPLKKSELGLKTIANTLADWHKKHGLYLRNR